MAKTEGVRRIVMTGKLIVLIGITLGVLAIVMIFGLRDTFALDPFLRDVVLFGASMAPRVVALGGLVWAAGWIAEGFSQPNP
jgi:hypothetical protein